jgi:hypothetical protein
MLSVCRMRCVVVCCVVLWCVVLWCVVVWCVVLCVDVMSLAIRFALTGNKHQGP